jgi:hypothetical protein
MQVVLVVQSPYITNLALSRDLHPHLTQASQRVNPNHILGMLVNV